MLGVLHGYSLEGSGSNLWTQYMAKAWCRGGRSLHLICQDKTPEKYDFVSEAYLYPADGVAVRLFTRATAYPGKCVLHRPELKRATPVFIASPEADRSRVIPMTEMSDGDIEQFLSLHYGILKNILETFPINMLHANHAVLLAQVALEARRSTGISIAVMPHGSDLEYAVEKDVRFHNLAIEALRGASLVFFTGADMKRRLQETFLEPNLESKMVELPLGVDTEVFRPVPRARREEEINSLIQEIQNWPESKGKVPNRGALDGLREIDWGQERILLFVGAFLPNKGLHLLLAALPWLEQRDSWRLVVAGYGMMGEFFEKWTHAFGRGEDAVDAFVQGQGASWFLPVKGYFEELKRSGKWEDYLQRARYLFTNQRVIFLGFLPHGLLRHLYPCGDLSIIPSLISEAGPLVYLESLASGCPPLGAGLGGMKEWSEEISRFLGNTGTLWPTLDPRPESMIPDLISKIPLTLKAGERWRSRFREFTTSRLDWTLIAKKWAVALDHRIEVLDNSDIE